MGGGGRQEVRKMVVVVAAARQTGGEVDGVDLRKKMRKVINVIALFFFWRF